MLASIAKLFNTLFSRSTDNRVKDYILLRSRVESAILKGIATPDEVLYEVLKSGTLTTDEFNNLRSDLAEKGLCEFAKPTEAAANRAKLDELMDLAASHELIDDNDLNSLRREWQANQCPAKPKRDQGIIVGNLKAHFGDNFPIDRGRFEEADPLIITSTSDYTSIEYSIVEYIFKEMHCRYKLRNQTLLSRNGRYIDRLVFDVYPPGFTEPDGTKEFYFDITEGYLRL